MAGDYSGFLQGGIAAGQIAQRQSEVAQHSVLQQAKLELDKAQLQREDAKLEMLRQDMNFNQSASILKQQFEQEKFKQEQANFMKEYGLKKEELSLQNKQITGTLGLGYSQLGLEATKTGIQQEQFGQELGLKERELAAKESQFGQTLEIQKQDVAYKNALLDYQRNPNNPENMLKLATLTKTMRDINAPLSPEGKLAYDKANNPELAVAIGTASAAGKAPAGYRFANPSDPTSALVPIPGGPATQLNPSQAAAASALQEASIDFNKAKSILFDKSGNVNDWKVWSSPLPFSEGKTMTQAFKRSLMSKLRLETGAAITDSEMERYEDMFMPSRFDTEEAIKNKVSNLENFLQTTSWNLENKPLIKGSELLKLLEKGRQANYSPEQIRAFYSSKQ